MHLSLALIKKQSLKMQTLVPHYRRMLLPVLLCVLLLQNQTHDITLSVLSDAFWQVAVFVAMTLTIYHFFSNKISQLYVNSKGEKDTLREVFAASFMGVLPGCGGAIVVITQYVSGRMSFGAVVAVLTSTMGDAAFLLIAAEPMTGMGIIALCFVVGILSGSVVNTMHGDDFLRYTIKSTKLKKCENMVYKKTSNSIKLQGILWQWLMLPGAIIGLLIAGQVDISSLFSINNSSIQYIGAAITISFIFLWASTREVSNYESLVSEDKKTRQSKVFQKVALDTNFVTSWVVVAFICFELVMFYGDFQLEGLFKQFGAFTPIAGVFIGMIPGCGPQIITTSLYLSGAIPLSAQIGNAISNDGDALFPAIALSPKVAFVATLYSSIPAALAAYGYYWLFE